MRVSIKLRRFIYNSHHNIFAILVSIRESSRKQISMHSLSRHTTEMHVQNVEENYVKIWITSSTPRIFKQTTPVWKSIFIKALQLYSIVHALRIPVNYWIQSSKKQRFFIPDGGHSNTSLERNKLKNLKEKSYLDGQYYVTTMPNLKSATNMCCS